MKTKLLNRSSTWCFYLGVLSPAKSKSTEKSPECFDGFKSRWGHVRGEIRNGCSAFTIHALLYIFLWKLPHGRPYEFAFFQKQAKLIREICPWTQLRESNFYDISFSASRIILCIILSTIHKLLFNKS